MLLTLFVIVQIPVLVKHLLEIQIAMLLHILDVQERDGVMIIHLQD